MSNKRNEKNTQQGTSQILILTYCFRIVSSVQRPTWRPWH